MKTRFVPQPFANQDSLGIFIKTVAANPALDVLYIAAAWAKRSGLARISGDVSSFRNRGGSAHAIVGVSEGGATSQGLQMLTTMFDTAHVFHDAGRTFHPKVYLASGPNVAALFVGSNNMTAGGVGWNYEAAMWIDLDLTLTEDKDLRDSVMTYINRLLADTTVCVQLNSSSLAQILSSPGLRIQNEDVGRRNATTPGTAPEDDDSASVGTVPQLFGQSGSVKRPLPPLPTTATVGAAPAPNSPASPSAPAVPSPGTQTAPVVPSPVAAGVTVQRRWFKTLDGTAAQHPPRADSKRTGNLRLSQAGFSIDHTRYFEQDFFQNLPWTPSARDPRTTEVFVSFDVTIRGASYGPHDLRVSHGLHRVAKQGNVSTVLHWETLNQILLATSYVGDVVSLESLSDGSYRLTIDRTATGPFVA